MCRQMAAPVLFVGIRGEQLTLNVRNLMMLAESPQNVYFLNSITTGDPRAVDDLSAWNLASYMCYTLQKRPQQ